MIEQSRPDKPRVTDWVLLYAQLPGRSPEPAGILLLDPLKDELHVSLVDSVSNDEEIKEFWDVLRQDLLEKSCEIGGTSMLSSLEERLSLFLQLGGPRQHATTADPEQTLAALFKEYVLSTATFSRYT